MEVGLVRRIATKPQVELSQFSSFGKDLFLKSRINGTYNSAQLPNTASDANDGIRQTANLTDLDR